MGLGVYGSGFGVRVRGLGFSEYGLGFGAVLKDVGDTRATKVCGMISFRGPCMGCGPVSYLSFAVEVLKFKGTLNP